MEDIKDGIVMVPFNYYFGDDMCLLDFNANWI